MDFSKIRQIATLLYGVSNQEIAEILSCLKTHKKKEMKDIEANLNRASITTNKTVDYYTNEIIVNGLKQLIKNLQTIEYLKEDIEKYDG